MLGEFEAIVRETAGAVLSKMAAAHAVARPLLEKFCNAPLFSGLQLSIGPVANAHVCETGT